MIKNIFKYALRNVGRNKRRTILTLIAIGVGVMMIVFGNSYIGGVMNNAVDDIIQTQIGHIRIAHKEFLRLERILPKEHLITDLSRINGQISALSEVVSVDRRIKFHVMLNHKLVNEPALAVGIEPEIIRKTMELDRAIRDGTYFAPGGGGLIIGSGLADKLGVTVNDELLLVTTDVNYSTYALPFTIAGIFQTGYSGMDNHMIYIPLTRAQEMLDSPDTAHEMLIFLNNRHLDEEVTLQIEEMLDGSNGSHDLEVIPWHRNDMIETLLPMTERVFGAILGIIMLIVALVILNTMLMSVMERFHEYGVMKALGFKNREVFGMILVEALYLGAVGSIIGGLVGALFSAMLEKTGIDLAKMMGEGIWEKLDIPIPLFADKLYPDFSLSILASAVVFGIITALIAVIYPAFKSSRMQPVEAFRSELKV